MFGQILFKASKNALFANQTCFAQTLSISGHSSVNRWFLYCRMLTNRTLHQNLNNDVRFGENLLQSRYCIMFRAKTKNYSFN
jgi:hypothetical protein